MPRTVSQHTDQTKPKRHYFGAEWIDDLVQVLNKEPSAPDVRLVREVIEICHGLSGLAERAAAPTRLSALGLRLETAAEVWGKEDLAQILQLENRLLEIMRLFMCVPQITLTSTAFSSLKPTIQLRWVLPKESIFAKFDKGRSMPLFDLLIHAVQSESISKVRSCSCGKYLFQKFAHQKYCSEDCRIKENQNSETAREYRRRKQREYYHLHKHKNTK